MDNNGIPAALQSMLDHHEIEQLLKRYARALDDRNYDLLDGCFTEDARIDYTEAGGIAGLYPEVKTWLSEVLEPIAEMQHFITNVEVEFDVDCATARTYTLNVNGLRQSSGEVQHMVVGAVYLDRLVRSTEGWRIAERKEQRLCVLGKSFGPGIE